MLVCVLYISTNTNVLLYLSMWLGKWWEGEREELEVIDLDIKGKRS